MKTRLITAAVVAAGLTASLSGAQAATPTLDGAKTTSLTASFTPTAQDNDPDFVTGSLGSAARVACAAPRCGRLMFTYKPAKGVKAPVGVKIGWSIPAEDFDVYLAEIAKDGSASQIATCGSAAGTSEQLSVDPSSLKSGKKYAVIVDFYRATGGDAVTATVTLPGTASPKTTVPDAVNSMQPVNCGL